MHLCDRIMLMCVRMSTLNSQHTYRSIKCDLGVFMIVILNYLQVLTILYIIHFVSAYMMLYKYPVCMYIMKQHMYTHTIIQTFILYIQAYAVYCMQYYVHTCIHAYIHTVHVHIRHTLHEQYMYVPCCMGFIAFDTYLHVCLHARLHDNCMATINFQCGELM